MTIIRDAGEEFPLKQAWRDVRDLKNKMGWQWPSYVTINRRWNGLPEAKNVQRGWDVKQPESSWHNPHFATRRQFCPWKLYLSTVVPKISGWQMWMASPDA